jgi:hypothetical protein
VLIHIPASCMPAPPRSSNPSHQCRRPWLPAGRPCMSLRRLGMSFLACIGSNCSCRGLKRLLMPGAATDKGTGVSINMNTGAKPPSVNLPLSREALLISWTVAIASSIKRSSLESLGSCSWPIYIPPRLLRSYLWSFFSSEPTICWLPRPANINPSSN